MSASDKRYTTRVSVNLTLDKDVKDYLDAHSKETGVPISRYIDRLIRSQMASDSTLPQDATASEDEPVDDANDLLTSCDDKSLILEYPTVGLIDVRKLTKDTLHHKLLDAAVPRGAPKDWTYYDLDGRIEKALSIYRTESKEKIINLWKMQGNDYPYGGA
ncbi:MAG: ribbon-helix-helix domain-containing protein [Defluviitaleaceae bacterium]|nr:ribbon-helix-helix domain-containing protein [Defluviitaleaceae bacterium]